jgi:GcrA cell cycle regulator
MFVSSTTWTPERIALLKSRFEAGFSCREIADDMGLSRNAVIGKISRLNLSRAKGEGRRFSKRERGPNVRRPNILNQHRILMALRAMPEPQTDEPPICDGHRCSLVELTKEKCRWPIGDPGAADFCFCGNKPVRGLPYCVGHARIAYQPARQRVARPDRAAFARIMPSTYYR